MRFFLVIYFCFNLCNLSGYSQNKKFIKAIYDPIKKDNHYILSSGKKVGIDSVFLFDFSADCESDSKIRFYDKKTDRVGFLSNSGKVVIPAIYNHAGQFLNGFAIAMKDGKRMCDDEHEFSSSNPCEHWFWKGNLVLINDKNEILLEHQEIVNFYNLDWFSIKNKTVGTDSTYKNFQLKNGSKISIKKLDVEFKNWFHNEFLPLAKTNTLKKFLFSELTLVKNNRWILSKTDTTDFIDYAWFNAEASTFYKQNSTTLFEYLRSIENEVFNIGYSTSEPLFLSQKKFPIYFDNCGKLKANFPCFEVTVTYKDYRVYHTFVFLRTEIGYRLIQIS